MEVEGDDGSEEVVVSPAAPGKRRAMEGPAGCVFGIVVWGYI
jgi:hypothetical protein